MAIKLTEVEIIPYKPKGGLIGFASFVLNNEFYVGNVAIHSRPDGSIRLVYPAKVFPNGKYIACFHPITKEAGKIIVATIQEKYNELFCGRYDD